MIKTIGSSIKDAVDQVFHYWISEMKANIWTF